MTESNCNRHVLAVASVRTIFAVCQLEIILLKLRICQSTHAAAERVGNGFTAHLLLIEPIGLRQKQFCGSS